MVSYAWFNETINSQFSWIKLIDRLCIENQLTNQPTWHSHLYWRSRQSCKVILHLYKTWLAMRENLKSKSDWQYGRHCITQLLRENKWGDLSSFNWPQILTMGDGMEEFDISESDYNAAMGNFGGRKRQSKNQQIYGNTTTSQGISLRTVCQIFWSCDWNLKLLKYFKPFLTADFALKTGIFNSHNWR